MRALFLACAIAISTSACSLDGSEGVCGLGGPPSRDAVEQAGLAGLDAKQRPTVSLEGRKTGDCENITHYLLSFDGGTFALEETDDDASSELDHTALDNAAPASEIWFRSGGKIIGDWSEQPVALRFAQGDTVIDVVCESSAGKVTCE